MSHKRRYKSNQWVLLILLTGFAGLTTRAWAANEIFDARGFTPNRDYFSELPYEHIDPLTGSLLLTFTDLVLPGNAGFELRIQRTYNSKIFKDYDNFGDVLDEDSWAGSGWTLHLGRVLHTPSGTPASVEMPDGSRQKLYQHVDSSGRFITRNFWVYDRNVNPPVLLLPDGTKYTLERSTALFIGGVSTPVRYPTRIEDPFGNFFTITYMSTPNDGIQSIIQDLGGGQLRTVTFTVIGARETLSEMKYTGSTLHKWTYTQVDANTVGYSRLTQVMPPIGPSWRYQYDTLAPVQNELTGVTTPQGGQIGYTYSDQTFHLGSNVPVTTRSLVQRSVSGRGVTAGSWTYAYALGTSENQSRITSPSPCGSITTTYTFKGVGNYGAQGEVWKIGLLESKVVADGGGSLETQSLAWQPSAPISNDDELVGNNYDPQILVPLVSTRTVTRGGQNYVTTNTYSTNASNFNDYGRPYQIDENGDLTGTRRTTRIFQYGFSPYIVDRISSETVTVTGGSESFAKSYSYNSANGFKTAQTIYGITTSYTPTTTRGNVASSTNNNNTTTYSYDWGLASTITTPMYPVIRVINPEGTIASERRQYWNGTSNQNTTTNFQYDLAFRPMQKTPQLGNATTTTYDNTGGAWMKVTRGSSWTQTNLDGLGRPTNTTNSVGIQTRIDYDACGRKSYESYPQASAPETTHGTSYSYDALNRVTRKTNNADNPDTFVRYVYGPGLQVAVTDENSHTATQGWKAFGDPSNARLMSLTEPNSQQTTYAYNVLGSLTRVTHAGLLTRTWTYFATTGLLQQETHPESGTVSYTYDAAGNVQTRTDFRGQTNYGHDGNNRLISITRPAGFTDYNTTFEYDGSDRRKLAQNTYVTSIFAYDAANRLVTRTDTVNGRTFTTSYPVYDGNDNLQQLDYPSGTQVTYAYDSENRISRVGKPGTPTYFASAFTYHPSGAVTSFQPAGSNALQQFTYDDRYRLKNLRTGPRDLEYAYDPVGNVLAISDIRPNMSRGFTYDVLDRVATASGVWGQSKIFSYDDLGNRTRTEVGSSVTFDYNPTTNRLASFTEGGTLRTLGYDAQGNTTADGLGGTHAYTADNMVRTATVAGATTIYYYDGDNLRTRKLEPSGVNHYYLHGPGDQILGEFGDPCVGQPPLPIRDYVYAAGRLLASVQPSAGVNTIGLTAAASSVGEATGPAQVSVRVSTSSPSGTVCPITVSYATANGTALAGIDYTATSDTLSFLVGTPNGTTQSISVPVVSDTLDEDAESFTVSLSNANGATLVSPSVQTITILDDDPPPSISINDVSVVEGDAGSLNAVFTISLSAASSRSITVDAATANGTAAAGSDYTATVVTGLVFAPGLVSRTLAVPVLGDTTDEPNETFHVNLTNPTNATMGDGQGVGTITDNDAPPSLSISDVTMREGDEGTGNAVFTVTLTAVSGWTIASDFATADGTATAGSDYAAVSGTVNLPPGSTTGTISVPIVVDGTNEPNETFFVNLSNPSNVTLADAQGLGTILNDDPVPVPAIELSHGSAQLRSLTQPDPAARQDWYRLGQKPQSSYEIVVDSTAVTAVSGLALERLSSDGVTVLQTGVPVASGAGFSRSLRWENATSAAINGQPLRVRNNNCSAPCSAADIYRVRAYETTYSIARFNNAGTQTTVVILQNPQPYAIGGTIWFWSDSGVLLASLPFNLASKATFGIDIATVTGAVGQSGSITVSNNGRYGDLAGKAGHLDPSTGFTFDTPLMPWPR